MREQVYTYSKNLVGFRLPQIIGDFFKTLPCGLKLWKLYGKLNQDNILLTKTGKPITFDT